MAITCTCCGKTLNFFSKKIKEQGNIYCAACHYKNFGKYRYLAIPNKLLNKTFSLAYPPGTQFITSETGDHLLTRSITKQQYVFHPILYLDNRTYYTKYIGVELSSGQVYEVTESSDVEFGPDAIDTHSAMVRCISPTEWQNLLDGFPDAIKEEFKTFSFENSSQFMSYPSQGQCIPLICIAVLPMDESVVVLYFQHTVYHIIQLTTEQYSKLKPDGFSLYKLVMSRDALFEFTKQTYGLEKKQCEEFYKTFLTHVQKGNNELPSNSFIMKDYGREIMETHVPENELRQLLQNLDKSKELNSFNSLVR